MPNGPTFRSLPADPPHLLPRIQRVSEELADFGERGMRPFATSSFQSNSLVLLHLLSRLAPQLPVYFLQTGYHFPETLRFRRSLARELGLDVRDLRSPISRHRQRDEAGRLLFASDPDRCCHLNKVLPLEPILAEFDVWISGVRASQSSTRAAMQRTAPGRRGILRYHPILDWSARDVHAYVSAHGLPSHPLEAEGYLSVGCAPCTRRPMDEPDLGGPELPEDGERAGRWAGMQKTECGLHLDEGDTP